MQVESTGFSLSTNDISVLHSAKEYKKCLLSLIASAKKRIYITALYLQNDDAGQEVLQALYQAKKENPNLTVNVFIDFHRAQRGLIGEKHSLGNRATYIEFAQQYADKINIFGVPVKRKELLGVWHFKGMVFDDNLLYTGASINDIYLHHEDKYRLDRYYNFSNAGLADSFCKFLDDNLIKPNLAPELAQENLPQNKPLKVLIGQLKRKLKVARFSTANNQSINGLNILPLIGFGRRKNQLNQVIRQRIRQAKTNIQIFTPYFNLPKPLLRDVNSALKRGVKISIIVGDKTANDFYIADEDKFSTIGIIPYIYENLLRNFLKRKQKFLDNGLLEIKLWRHEANSFHLKGMVVDNKWHLLTGNNLNPRAWSLDIENGLLIEDKHQELETIFAKELEQISIHTSQIKHADQIEAFEDYPEKPKKLLKKMRVVQIGHLLKRFL